MCPHKEGSSKGKQTDTGKVYDRHRIHSSKNERCVWPINVVIRPLRSPKTNAWSEIDAVPGESIRMESTTVLRRNKERKARVDERTRPEVVAATLHTLAMA